MDNFTIDSWEALYAVYPMNREDMTKQEERDFIEYCYALYEKDGFSLSFSTPYDEHEAYIGKPFRVKDRLTEKDAELASLPMWNIIFGDGAEISAWPEEITNKER